MPALIGELSFAAWLTAKGVNVARWKEKAGLSTVSWGNGAPFQMLFFLATIMMLAAIGDVRILRFGMPRGRPRLARHLWRMCFALFIAAGSFFAIRERVAQVLPEPFTSGPMRALPIVILFGTMFYWLRRVRGRRTLPVRVRHDAVPLATRAK